MIIYVTITPDKKHVKYNIFVYLILFFIFEIAESITLCLSSISLLL